MDCACVEGGLECYLFNSSPLLCKAALWSSAIQVYGSGLGQGVYSNGPDSAASYLPGKYV